MRETLDRDTRRKRLCLIRIIVFNVDDRSIEEILDTIGDQHARRVLAAISREPKDAKELAEEGDLSLPTVYRRIEMLDEYDLITDETLVAEDGNHYKVYQSNFESTVISLEDDEYKVRIYREENLPDRFSQLWDELGAE
jgi:predicted transcriptional regulator